MAEGLRDEAMALCPCARTMRVRARPKPEEQPVMSQVSWRLGVLGLDIGARWGGLGGKEWKAGQ